MFRVIIAGTRDFNDYNLLKDKCNIYLKNLIPDVVIVSGTCKGADLLGEKYANENGLQVERFPANWSLGKGAGYIRNQQMAENADGLIAFWDGKSRGTKNMIDIATRKGLKVRIVHY